MFRVMSKYLPMFFNQVSTHSYLWSNDWMAWLSPLRHTFIGTMKSHQHRNKTNSSIHCFVTYLSQTCFFISTASPSRGIFLSFGWKIQLPSMKTSGPPWSAFWYPRCEIFEIFLSYIKSASSFIFITISRKKRFDPHHCWPNQLTVL